MIDFQRKTSEHLCKGIEETSLKLASLTEHGGFMEIPVPKDGRPLNLLIIQSFNGGAVFPKAAPPNRDLLNTKFYVAYDMEGKKFLALRDDSIGFEGKDFVMVYSRRPDGTVVVRPLKGQDALDLCEQFGIAVGPTRY